MRNPFSRMFHQVTVHACAGCEGGSGAFYNADTGELTRCAVCLGSGLESSATEPGIVDLTVARNARSKQQRNAA